MLSMNLNLLYEEILRCADAIEPGISILPFAVKSAEHKVKMNSF